MAEALHPAVPRTLPDPLPRAFAWVLSLRYPGWVGVGAAALFFVAGLPWISGERLVLSTQLMYSLYFVWVAFALPSFVRGTASDVTALEPNLRPGPEPLGEAVFRAAQRAVPAGIGFGLGVAAFDVWVFSLTSPGEIPTGAQSPWVVVSREVAVCLPAFAVLGWAFGASRALSRAAAERARVNLLDPTALTPLGRCGARLAFWWLLMIAFSFAPLLLPEAQGNLLIFLPWLLGFAAMAAFALAIPSWGAHQALASTKQAELARVRHEIGRAREGGEESRLPGLLAWEQRVERVSEWPVDAHSLRLTGLTALIPFASWVAGALVERVVEAALG